MKTLRLHLALVPAALLLAIALPAGAAAPAASAPARAAASAPPIEEPAPTRSVPQKHLATPQEQRDSAAGTNQIRPESRVTSPLINVPINPSGAGKPALVPQPRGKAAPAGGVDDSAARCNAIADAQARKECLDKLR